MTENAYSIIKPAFVVKYLKPRKWKDDPIEDCFYFLNHSFTSKNNPTRKYKERFGSASRTGHVCCVCGIKSFNTKPWVALKRVGKNGRFSKICPSCYKAEKEKELVLWSEKKEEDDYRRIDALRYKLAECTKLGTCDIIAAHHDLLKEDPERLTTDFIIGMVCGVEGVKIYNDR